jgi:hypothetical protein
VYISFIVLGSIGASAGYDPDSMNAQFINNHVVVASLELGKAISKDITIIVGRSWGIVRIRAVLAISMRSDVIRAGQAMVTQMNYYICLAEPSRLEECTCPVFNTMVWQ